MKSPFKMLLLALWYLAVHPLGITAANPQTHAPAESLVVSSVAVAEDSTTAQVVEPADSSNVGNGLAYPSITARRLRIEFGPFPVGDARLSNTPNYQAKLDTIRDFLTFNSGIPFNASFEGHADTYQGHLTVVNTRLSHGRREGVISQIDTTSFVNINRDFVLGSDKRAVAVVIEETPESLANRAMRAAIDFIRANGGSFGNGANGKDGHCDSVTVRKIVREAIASRETTLAAYVQESLSDVSKTVSRFEGELSDLRSEVRHLRDELDRLKQRPQATNGAFAKDERHPSIFAGGFFSTPTKFYGGGVGVPYKDFRAYLAFGGMEYKEDVLPASSFLFGEASANGNGEVAVPWQHVFSPGGFKQKISPAGIIFLQWENPFGLFTKNPDPNEVK